MQVSVYFNDNGVVNSVDIYEASLDECLSIIRKFDFGENEDNLTDKYEQLKKMYELLKVDCQYYMGNYSRCSDELNSLHNALNDIQEECDCWKEKYEIECQHNDDIKKAYDELVKDVDDLIDERDEYKEIASDRDDLKVENDKIKELCEMLQDESKELQKRISLAREDFLEANRQMSELIAENDKLKMALVGAKCTCATLEQDKFFWKNRWESEFEEGVRAKKELEECKQKKSES